MTVKKKAVVLFFAILALAAGAFYCFNRPDPPVETKFVQEVRSPEEEPLTKPNLIVKKPENYALLPNPKHVYQSFNNCGPATLSMMLSWFGQNVNQKELGHKMRPFQNPKGDNDDKTIFTYEFVDWAKKYGLESIGRVNGDIELLKTFTANGIPVVVKTWLNLNDDIGHFRVVRGFDERESSLAAGRQVIIQDDSYHGPNKKISYYDFLSMWQPFNYAYIIVYTPDQKELVEAIVGEEIVESVAWKNALVRAQKESELAPENVYPYFNMSTSYYHLGDYQNSVSSFEAVENRLPRRMLWYQIGPIQSYRKLGDFERVFKIIENILENGNRAYSELYQIRGEILLTQGDLEAAKEQFELALTYNENFMPAHDALKSL